MRLWILLLIALVAAPVYILAGKADIEDNEFAEFEDDDIEMPEKVPTKSTEKAAVPKQDDFEDDDFGVVDEDEIKEEEQEQHQEQQKIEPLKFTDVPAHFRSNWSAYQVEALILGVIICYLMNYAFGRTQNSTIAESWFSDNKSILEEQFALVGDDGLGDSGVVTGGHLVRETDYSFTVWCSGRVGVSNLAISIKTLKRQDLLSRLIGIFYPQNDRLTLKFDLENNELDSFVIATGQKKPTTRLYKELLDVSTFTSEKKNTSQIGLPSSFVMFAESAEVSNAVFDNTLAGVVRKYEKAIECIHISDQFSGPKPPEGETFTRMPTTSNLFQVILNLNEINSKEESAEILQLVFFLLDKVRRLRLSKEAKAKADKRRREVEEAYVKSTHQMRQEAAQARREQKTRERKQRLMEEEDPEKQRALERQELKREAKLKQPKMKQLKMKM